MLSNCVCRNAKTDRREGRSDLLKIKHKLLRKNCGVVFIPRSFFLCGSSCIKKSFGPSFGGIIDIGFQMISEKLSLCIVKVVAKK